MASALLSFSYLLTIKGWLADGLLKVLKHHSWFFFLLWCIKHALSWHAVQGIIAWSNELKSCTAFCTMLLGRHLSDGGQEWLAVNFYDSFQIGRSSIIFHLNFLGGSVLLCIMARLCTLLQHGQGLTCSVVGLLFCSAVPGIMSRLSAIEASWLAFCAFIFCLGWGLGNSLHFLIIMLVFLWSMWFVEFLPKSIVLVIKTPLTWLPFFLQPALVLAVVNDYWFFDHLIVMRGMCYPNS